MKRLKWVTPHFMWFGINFNISRLRSFGCRAYINIPKERRVGKFGDTAKHGILVGYQYRQGIHNWRILTSGNRVEFSHDVVFDEAVFPGISPDSLADPLFSSIFDEEDSASLLSSHPSPVLIPEPVPLEDPPVDSAEPAAEENLTPAFSSLPTPKPGFDYVPASQPAPREISSTIDPANIITTKRRAHIANSILTTQPFYEAIFAMAATVSDSPSVPKTNGATNTLHVVVLPSAKKHPGDFNWLIQKKIKHHRVSSDNRVLKPKKTAFHNNIFREANRHSNLQVYFAGRRPLWIRKGYPAGVVNRQPLIVIYILAAARPTFPASLLEDFTIYHIGHRLRLCENGSFRNIVESSPRCCRPIAAKIAVNISN
ncbi:hypothetical protein MJO29_011866 [Puccinia striiformis f. sp. tritici]|nr:hypothetical protein MJO29_011866 [Puccinia striiformis f. sp. tritici]